MTVRLLEVEPVAMGQAVPPFAQTHIFLVAEADLLNGTQQTTLHPASTSLQALVVVVGVVQGRRGTSTVVGRLETLHQQRASTGSPTLAAAVEAEAAGEQVEMGVAGSCFSNRGRLRCGPLAYSTTWQTPRPRFIPGERMHLNLVSNAAAVLGGGGEGTPM